MRIASLMVYEQIKRAMQSSLSELSEKNTQLFTGKKINKPSDSIIGMMKAMGYKVTINENEQYQRNIIEANIQLKFADKVMTSVSDSLGNLKQLISMGGSAQSQENRDFYSKQAADWRDHLRGLSNTKLRDRYIFSGYKTDQRTFAYNSATYHYDYNGDVGDIGVLIDKGVGLPVNILGSRSFSFGLNGQMPTELYDGTPVNYTQAVDPATGVTTVTVEIGTAGNPGYDTFTFSNIMDVANIMSYAWEYQNLDGSALDADPTINEQMALRRISALAGPLDNARTQILNVQSEIGTRLVYLNDEKSRLDNSTLNLKDALSKTEDADITETITDIKKAEVALEALRASSSNILSQSLFDFLK